MESEPQLNKTGLDPRRKDGQGLDFWAAALLEKWLITKEQYDDFIAKNNSKEKMMEERGLPQLEHYGFFHSVSEIKEKLLSLKDQRFIIRCTSKENGDIKRLIDTGLDEACEFAEKLPGGFENWQVEMKEFVVTKVSGTIIVEPSGKAHIETWKGAHYLNTENVPRYYAEFDPDPAHFDHSYQWQASKEATDLPEIKEYAMKAISYMFPYLKPKPNEPIYIEYGVKPNGKVYFIEVNNSSVLTGK